MKPSALFALGLALLHHDAKAAPPLDVDRLIECLIQVEGGKWGDVGGAANIGFAAWTQHSPHAYQLSRNKETSDR